MHSLSQAKADFLMLVAGRIVPEVVDLDEPGTRRFEQIIDGALAGRTAEVRRQFAVFLGVIRFAPAVRWGRTFEKLSAARQDAVLAWFEGCPVGLLRKGFWGLKTMVFMGYYGQPELWSEIGYAPRIDSRDGCDA